MLTYARLQPKKDEHIRSLINSVVAAHPAWGKRLVYGWIREQGHAYTYGCVKRVYRQAGHAAQWHKRTRKVKRNMRINPVAEHAHHVWCMDFAEDRLMSGRKLTALLVKDEATSFGLSLTVQRSFKAVDVERVLDQLAERYGAPRYVRSDNGGQKRAASRTLCSVGLTDAISRLPTLIRESRGRTDSQKVLLVRIAEKVSMPKSSFLSMRHTSFPTNG
jgi:transposase InsO family protein